jgi:hypothetical protein
LTSTTRYERIENQTRGDIKLNKNLLLLRSNSPR